MKREVAKLIKVARKAGADVRMTKNGHWRVQNQNGLTFISTTPSSPSGPKAARADLRRMGIAA